MSNKPGLHRGNVDHTYYLVQVRFDNQLHETTRAIRCEKVEDFYPMYKTDYTHVVYYIWIEGDNQLTARYRLSTKTWDLPGNFITVLDESHKKHNTDTLTHLRAEALSWKFYRKLLLIRAWFGELSDVYTDLLRFIADNAEIFIFAAGLM